MTGPILPIANTIQPEMIRPAGEAAAGGGFKDVLQSAIQSVESTGQEAASSITSFLQGEGGELHTTILAAQRAELAFDMFLQVRNKAISAYTEILHMQM